MFGSVDIVRNWCLRIAVLRLNPISDICPARAYLVFLATYCQLMPCLRIAGQPWSPEG